jgi:hypothetical protein
MTVLAASTIQEYAKQFWRRERDKGNQDGIQSFAAIERGADPVKLLREKHPYKLPRPENSQVRIVSFTSRDEIEDLFVHDYMPNDKWMQERGLTPTPKANGGGVGNCPFQLCALKFASEKYLRHHRKDRDEHRRGIAEDVAEKRR